MQMSQRARRMQRRNDKGKKIVVLNLVSLMDIFTILVFFLLVLKNVLQEDDEVPVPVEVPKEHEGFNLPAV